MPGAPCARNAQCSASVDLGRPLGGTTPAPIRRLTPSSPPGLGPTVEGTETTHPAPAPTVRPEAATPATTVLERAPSGEPLGEPLNGHDARNLAVAAHLSGFVAAWVALGFLGPLVVMLTAGRRSAYVRRHAVEAVNFNLSILLWLLISGVLVVVLIGLPMLLGVGVLYLVASIAGAAAAARGEEYRYPLTLRLVS